MDISKLEYYLKKKLAGSDYSELREEMRAEGMTQEEIDLMVPEIDAVAIEIRRSKEANTISAKTLVGWGIIIVSGIALITLLLIGVRGGLIIIAMLGSMLSGLSMLSQKGNSKKGKFDKFNR